MSGMTARRLASTLLLIFAIAVRLAAQPAEADPKKFEKIKDKAEKGDAEAQCRIGDCYYLGDGVTRDAGEGVKWYRKSSEQGFLLAQNNLGVCYRDGEGVAKDLVEAAKWFRRAADQGFSWAQYNLGVLSSMATA